MNHAENTLVDGMNAMKMNLDRSTQILGHLSKMKRDPLGMVMEALNKNQPIVRLRFGYISAFFLFDPSEIRRVLMDDGHRYTKTTRGYDKLRLLLGNGLVTSEGDFWLRQRRIAQPAFHRRCIEGFAKSMINAATHQCLAWQAPALNGTPIDVAEAMNALTLNIAGDTLMSVDTSVEVREIGESMSIVLERFNHLSASLLPKAELWPSRKNLKMWRAIKRLRQVTDSIIEARRKSEVQIPDLLGMFMAAEDPDSGETMSDQQLRDEVLTMLLAGHETTANSLTWTLHLLAQHPHIAHRLEDEVDRVLGAGPVKLHHLKDLVFLKQVIKESLRLYPPVWTIAREVARTSELGGFEIPKGSYVFMSQYAMHRHPNHWTCPEAFDPSRFAPENEEVDRFVYFPFIRGRRQCIGDRFADMELSLILATLVHKYQFSMLPGHTIQLDPSVTLRPKNGLKMTVKSRRSLGSTSVSMR